MRASTLFTLTIAILIGLGVAIWAKVSGVFNSPAQVVAEKQDIKILVAAKNIFAGDTIDGTWVTVRSLKPEEVDHYKKHKEDYLPPVINAAVLRIASKDITADQPMVKSYLEPMAKPSALNTRLMPEMRAVSVSLEKDQAAGGMIQTGEWVDVMLTSDITLPNGGGTTTRTATVAPKVRVVAKRNTLWPVFAPLPKDKPIQFTLEVNTYRAALIEFARTKGKLTLVPLPQNEQIKLEAERTALMKKANQKGVIHPVLFMQEGSKEAKAEEQRINSFNLGEMSVDERDLMRLFNLSITTAPPPIQKVEIMQMVGLNHMQPARFETTGERIYPEPKGARSGSGSSSPAAKVSAAPSFQFGQPACPECELNNKRNRARIKAKLGLK